MGNFVCRVFAIALLLAAVVNFSAVLGSSPAFNESEREQGVSGEWRVTRSAAHYSKSEYQIQLARGYMRDPGLVYDPDLGLTVFVGEQETNARLEASATLLKSALRLDPANARAWTYLAEIQAEVGDVSGLNESLNVSWALAPYNLHLAIRRLLLTDELLAQSGDTPTTISALPDENVRALLRDAEVLQLHNVQLLEDMALRSKGVEQVMEFLPKTEQSGS